MERGGGIVCGFAFACRQKEGEGTNAPLLMWPVGNGGGNGAVGRERKESS